MFITCSTRTWFPPGFHPVSIHFGPGSPTCDVDAASTRLQLNLGMSCQLHCKLQPVKHIKPVTIYDMKLEAVRKHPCFRFKSHSKKETEMGGMKGEHRWTTKSSGFCGFLGFCGLVRWSPNKAAPRCCCPCHECWSARNTTGSGDWVSEPCGPWRVFNTQTVLVSHR